MKRALPTSPLPPLPRRKLDDEKADRTVRETQAALKKVAGHHVLGTKLLTALPDAAPAAGDRIRLVNATLTKIRHGLGRAYQGFRIVSLVPVTSGATGHVEEALLDASNVPVDPTREIWLTAIGYAASDIDIRLEVF